MSSRKLLRSVLIPLFLVLSSLVLIVSIAAAKPKNAPFAAFNYSFVDDDPLQVIFQDESYNPEGEIYSWDWAFGDGQFSTKQHPTHTYAVRGSYLVTLTVTKSSGERDWVSKTVNVNDGPTFFLWSTRGKVKGDWKVDLTWSGGPAGLVDIYRDLQAPPIATVTAMPDGSGEYTDWLGGREEHIYQVCEHDSWTNCSNTSRAN